MPLPTPLHSSFIDTGQIATIAINFLKMPILRQMTVIAKHGATTPATGTPQARQDTYFSSKRRLTFISAHVWFSLASDADIEHDNSMPHSAATRTAPKSRAITPPLPERGDCHAILYCYTLSL